MALLDPIFDPIFSPLLNWSPLVGIVVIALIITIIVTGAYWKFTDQAKMKILKQEQKDFQKRMKELREHPEQMMKVQKEAMSKNMEYMKHSMKPTLITMLPILLIFGWMSGAIAFEPIYPGESFVVSAQFAEGISGTTVLDLIESGDIGSEGLAFANSEASQEIDSEGMATWRLRAAAEGLYDFDVVLDAGEAEIRESKDVLITTDLDYSEQIAVFSNSDIEQISIGYEKLRPLGSFAIFGWQPGWLAIYIVLSLIFSLSLRRIFDLH